jgi:hypothetical protein
MPNKKRERESATHLKGPREGGTRVSNRHGQEPLVHAPVAIGELIATRLVEVGTHKDILRGFHVQITAQGLAHLLALQLDPFGDVFANDHLLQRDVDGECTRLEEGEELTTQVLVGLTRHEGDVVFAENLLRARSEEKLEVLRRSKHLASDVGVFAEDHEPDRGGRQREGEEMRLEEKRKAQRDTEATTDNQKGGDIAWALTSQRSCSSSAHQTSLGLRRI